MTSTVSSETVTGRQRWLWYVLLLLLFGGVALLFTRQLARYGVRQEKEDLQAVVTTAAAAFAPATVMALRGSAEDAGSPALQAVRDKLARIHQANPQARFVYLMRWQQGQFIFLADAEPESSPDYSPPGQPYTEEIAGLKQVLAIGLPVIEEPYHDSWGYWVSALTPIADPASGRIVAVLGMDVKVDSWERNVAGYRVFAIVISLLFACLFVLFLFGHDRQQRHRQRMGRLNLSLQEELAERSRIQEKLNRIASIDGLTGIPNRREFDLQLRQAWDRARERQEPLSLLMADLDHFKAYNDRHGHLAGDDCLQRIATRLAELAHATGASVARYGGEEFAMILPHTNAAGALRLAEQLRCAVRELHIAHEDGPARIVTTSVGCATTIPDPGASPLDLVNDADRALYRAKHAGRDCLEGPLGVPAAAD